MSGETQLVTYYIHEIEGALMAVPEGQLLESPECHPIGIGPAGMDWDFLNPPQALIDAFGDGMVRLSRCKHDETNGVQWLTAYDVEVPA